MFPKVEDITSYEAPTFTQAPIVEDLDSDSDVEEIPRPEATVKQVEDEIEIEEKVLADLLNQIKEYKAYDTPTEYYSQYLIKSKDECMDRLSFLKDYQAEHHRKLAFKNIVIKKPTEVSTFNQEISFNINEPIQKDKSIHKKQKLKRQSNVAYKPKIINICNNYNSFVQLNIRL